jgi:hypothetical protein
MASRLHPETHLATYPGGTLETVSQVLSANPFLRYFAGRSSGKNLRDIDCHSKVKVPVKEDTLKHTLSDLGALTDTVTLHARLGELLLRLLKPPDTRTGGKTWEQEETRNGDRETNDTIDDEYPAPGRNRLSDGLA